MTLPADAPRLPPLRQVVSELRELNADFDGPGNVALWLITAMHDGPYWAVGGWESEPYPYGVQFGREEIPGDERAFDTLAVARRLLASARDGGAR